MSFIRSSRAQRGICSLLVACVVLAAPMHAQAPASATLTGQVVDGKTGQTLSDVGVQIVGTTRGVQTGIDGRFRFLDVPAGTLTIQLRRIGYQPKTITGLLLEAGKTLDQPVGLDR